MYIFSERTFGVSNYSIVISSVTFSKCTKFFNNCLIEPSLIITKSHPKLKVILSEKYCINRLTCDVTIDEANFNVDPLNSEIKQLVDAYSGATDSALSDRQYIETFLQAILQKLMREHPRCVQRA